MSFLNETAIIIYALIGGFLPALVWLWFWLKEDAKKPEPAQLIFESFIAGGIAVVGAFVLQRLYVDLSGQADTVNQILESSSLELKFLIASLPILLIWSFIEELVKFLAVWVTSLKNRANDEPIDPMIYMITGALGFVAVENTLFIFDALFANSEHLDFLLTGNLRFLGASIVHIVSSAVIGAALSLSYCSSWKIKLRNLLIGFILGTILHALFNFLIIISNEVGMFKIFACWWIIAILIILFFEKVKRIVCSPNFKDQITTNL